MKKNLLNVFLCVMLAMPFIAHSQTTGDFRSAMSGPWQAAATATSTLGGGAVTVVSITYGHSTYTIPPTVTFGAAPGGGTTATGLAIIDGSGTVTSVNITNPGSGYSTAPSVTFSGGNPTSFWETFDGTTWVSTANAPQASTNLITIRTGHVITLRAGTSCGNLTIENGATLNSSTSGSTTFYLRAGAGTAGNTTVITNNGTLGGSAGTPGVGDGIALEHPTQCKNLTYTGTGVCNIYRFRINNGNSNNPVLFTVDGDISLTGPFTAYYNSASNSATDDYAITINSGKTVSFRAAGGSFHAASATNANPAGKYTYNINGTVDFGSSTSTAYISMKAGGTVNLNIDGVLKLGTGGINTSSNAATLGFNIGTAGLLDASSVTTASNFNIGTNSLIVTGNGKLKRPVGAVATVFPLATSPTSKSPVTLTNTGTTGAIAVGVKNSFDQLPASSPKVVNNQWSIDPDVVGANLAVALEWPASAQNPAFVGTDPIFASRYDGANWIESPASISGSDPYVATFSGVTQFGKFSIGNTATLPLDFVAFTAKPDAFGKTVNLNWITTNEKNTKAFEIQKRTVEGNFTKIGVVKSINLAGQNTYSFTDQNATEGDSYYRIAQIDNDGSSTFSKIVAVNCNAKGTLSVYPNPVGETLNIRHALAASGTNFKILNSEGKAILSSAAMVNTTATTVDVSTLDSGIYVLMFDGKAVKFVKK